jgi:hypothetical protein
MIFAPKLVTFNVIPFLFFSSYTSSWVAEVEVASGCSLIDFLSLEVQEIRGSKNEKIDHFINFIPSM